MKKKLPLLLFMLSSCLFGKVFAQGCSDAGFCTIGNLSKKTGSNTYQQRLGFMSAIGVGDEDVFVFTPAVQYELQFKNHWTLQGRLTGNFASGNLGDVFGAGDLFLSGTYAFTSKSSWKKSVTLGAKAPLNNSNLLTNGQPLPMQYQSSLGTLDFIAGFAMANEKWQFAAGWQQPLTGTNGNNFLPIYRDEEAANNYLPSNDFDRKGDVLLRVDHNWRLKNKWLLTPGLLGIYHLGEDTYIDGNVSNKPIPIKGSEGMTLNATLGVHWITNSKYQFGITAGVPLVVRDARPDGLTRSFVVAPEFHILF